MMKLLKDAQAAYDKLLRNVDNYRDREFLELKLNTYQKLTRAYKFKATGDCCKGDKIAFVKRIWRKEKINSYGKLANRIVGYEIIEGEIIKESYGSKKQQHTFTVLLPNKEKLLIKGRNLYAVGVWRKEWANEADRLTALNEKHLRGGEARAARRERIQERNY